QPLEITLTASQEPRETPQRREHPRREREQRQRQPEAEPMTVTDSKTNDDSLTLDRSANTDTTKTAALTDAVVASASAPVKAVEIPDVGEIEVNVPADSNEDMSNRPGDDESQVRERRERRSRTRHPRNQNRQRPPRPAVAVDTVQAPAVAENVEPLIIDLSAPKAAERPVLKPVIIQVTPLHEIVSELAEKSGMPTEAEALPVEAASASKAVEPLPVEVTPEPQAATEPLPEAAAEVTPPPAPALVKKRPSWMHADPAE
ncbi:MAG: hypothetical protein ACK4RS_05640, partial [Thiothrix sp.]